MFDNWVGYMESIIACVCAGLVCTLSLVSLTSSVTAAPQAPGVELGPDHTQQASAGQLITYNHILTNTGTATDTFSLETLSGQRWPVELLVGPSTTETSVLALEVGAQMTASVQVSLTIPQGAAGVTEITVITATSQLSPTVQDTAKDTTFVHYRTYLPLAMKRWHPIPYQPTLNPISNPDGDDKYYATWTESPSRLADIYTLEEATDAAFTTGFRTACTTAQQSCLVSGRPAGTYYYRVQGYNPWGYSGYSNIETATVLLPDIPTLNAISNADGDSSYSVTWSTAARATSYTLQEDTHSTFNSPATVYSNAGQSWSTTGRSPGTYYYRVRANGPTGQSGWSNVEAVTVLPPPTPIPAVVVLSSNAFVPYEGASSLYIVGEVSNNTSSNVGFVRINATLRDLYGNVVDSDYSYSMIDRLAPSMTSPFLVLFWEPPTWASYELVVTWDTASRGPYPLEVLNSTSYFDSYNEYHVVGEIKNQYSESRTFVKAFVTLYDANGEVIGADYNYTNPDDLVPGQTASFDTGTYFWKYKPDKSKVARHLLQVYDD